MLLLHSEHCAVLLQHRLIVMVMVAVVAWRLRKLPCQDWVTYC